MDVPVGEKFRARTHRSKHDEIAALSIDLLATADRGGDHPCWSVDGLCRFGGLGGGFAGDVELAFTSVRRREYRQVQAASGFTELRGA